MRRLGPLLVVAGLLLTALVSPVSAQNVAADSDRRAPRQVRIVLLVRDCETCLLRPVQAHGPSEPQTYWSGKPQLVGPDGRVAFRVSVAHTAGMSFSIQAPWAYSDTAGGVRYVVTRYGGFEPGEHVSARAAAPAHQATYCWAGTNRNRTLEVQVVGYRTEQLGEPALGLRSYVVRTLPTGDAEQIPSANGVISTDTPWCPKD